jgi:cohesin complex subunit SA-1/2
VLLDENPAIELTDMDGTNLVRMLHASARKAVGERIVPAVDNRKLYYNKGQKVSSPFLWSFSGRPSVRGSHTSGVWGRE